MAGKWWNLMIEPFVIQHKKSPHPLLPSLAVNNGGRPLFA